MEGSLIRWFLALLRKDMEGYPEGRGVKEILLAKIKIRL